MKMGIGGLKWRPEDFWASTLTEFFDCIHGHNDSMPGASEDASAAPSRDEMSELVARYGGQ